jgi:hypothetical protein
MISAWTKHLKTEDEKTRFRNSVYGSKLVLERLQELLKEVEEDLNKTELSAEIYDIPNWDYRQADMNGFRRCLNIVNKIITLDQGK